MKLAAPLNDSKPGSINKSTSVILPYANRVEPSPEGLSLSHNNFKFKAGKQFSKIFIKNEGMIIANKLNN